MCTTASSERYDNAHISGAIDGIGDIENIVGGCSSSSGGGV